MSYPRSPSEQLRALDEQLQRYNERIERIACHDEVCRRLTKVDGVGPMTATAFLAAIGDACMFNNGRQAAAWLGMVPRQNSSSGKVMLLGITKRGDRHLRKLLIHGARTVVKHARNKHDARSQWINRLVERRGANVAAVALANKNARILWALMARNEEYRPATL